MMARVGRSVVRGCSRRGFTDGEIHTSVYPGSAPPYSRLGSDDDSGDCDDYLLGCCCSICICVGYWFCCGKMKKSRRIEILWFWLIILALGSGLGVGLGMFGKNEQEVSPTDMRIVTEKVSTLFCEELALHSFKTFRAYLFEKKPRIDEHHHQNFFEKRHHFIEVGHTVHWGFYLLKGSNTTVTSCTHDFLQLFVIKGYRNLKKWQENKFCSSCYIVKHSFSHNCMGSNNSKDLYTLKVNESDEYYFSYANFLSDTSVYAEFNLQRTLYDVSSAKHSCREGRFCSFDFSFASNQVVVYHISEFHASDDQAKIKTRCTARIWVYLCIFFVGPLMIGAMFSVLVMACCSDPPSRPPNETNTWRYRRYRTVNPIPNERSPLLWGHPYSSGAPFPPQPPKYEDIVRDNGTSPPCYEEATGTR